MKQPRVPLPPSRASDYQNGANALLRHMTPEGRHRTEQFWEARKHPTSTASAK